jgi:DNA-binding CsgD family transcriptional regulator
MSLDSLTGRQREVAELVGAGCSYDDIGKRLGISPVTARVHVNAIDAKTGAEGSTPYRRVMRWVLSHAA